MPTLARAQLLCPLRPAARGAAAPARCPRVTESRFCHGWTLHQLADGYRYCADDVVCSHLAMEARPGARRLLELGSGVGTIGLLWLGQQPRPPPPGSCRLLEAQEVSVALCRRTLRRWGLEDSVDLRHGDLREPETVASLGTGFDLVVTNPPYMQPNVGALPRSSQKRHCRHELRGGLRDFCAAARAALAPGHGRLCLVHTASRDAEVSETLREFGFQILRRVGIFWRGSRKSVAFVAASGAPGGAATGGPGPAEEAVEVQQADGAWSPQYRGICEQLGL
ncbi:unnamed protein product [Prorocentrum cordatum]|uniref:Methyltransferase small domain-containing protein n=1 Tax=Prorocentrum cordatum TaxID=2364126 RepID=A0ABN9Y7K3_9DINO|nr:unnamed protein product [Polarella glacialis]